MCNWGCGDLNVIVQEFFNATWVLLYLSQIKLNSSKRYQE